MPNQNPTPTPDTKRSVVRENTAEKQPKNLNEARLAIMGELHSAEKSGENKHHSFKYAKEEDFMKVLRPLLIKYQVVIDVMAENVAHDGSLTTVKLVYTVLHVPPGTCQVRPWFGTGSDTLDKGLYKAYTGGNKYFLYKYFQISTTDDPDETSKTDAGLTRKASKKQKEDLVALAGEIGITAQKLSLMVRQRFQVGMMELTSVQAEEIANGMAKRKEANDLM